jgi:hypothetical protein
MGNVDKSKKDNIVRHKLNHLLEARYIRFNPLTWNLLICMRVDVYACEMPKIELPTTLPTTQVLYPITIGIIVFSSYVCRRPLKLFKSKKFNTDNNVICARSIILEPKYHLKENNQFAANKMNELCHLNDLILIVTRKVIKPTRNINISTLRRLLTIIDKPRSF